MGVLGVVKKFSVPFYPPDTGYRVRTPSPGYKVVQRTVDKENGRLGLSHALAHICLFPNRTRPGVCSSHLTATAPAGVAQPGIPSHIGKLVLGTGIGAVGDNQLDTIRAAAACQLQHGSSAHRHPVEYHGNILPKAGSQVLDPAEHILALIVIKAHILATGGTKRPHGRSKRSRSPGRGSA